MTKLTQKTTKRQVGTVAPIRPVPDEIEPPESWSVHSAFGMLRTDETPAVRLVRLADMVRWLMQTRELPRADALGKLCDALPLDAMAWVYRVNAISYAAPVPPDAMFGYKTAAQIAKAKEDADQTARQYEFESRGRSEWGRELRSGFGSHVENGRISKTWPDPVEPGLPALKKALLRCWSNTQARRSSEHDTLDDPRMEMVNALAVPLAKAHVLWGWGRMAQLDTKTNDEKGFQPAIDSDLRSLRNWTPERLELLAKDFAGASGKTVKAKHEAVAMQWGMGTDNVKKQLARHKKNTNQEQEKQTHWGQLGSLKSSSKK